MQRNLSVLSRVSREAFTHSSRFQFARSVHTTNPPQAPLPVWAHSLMGNQAAIRERFQQNREELLRQFPQSSLFNPVLELLKVTHCDQEGERIRKALELINTHPELQPIIAAAAVIAKNTNLKLLYVGAFTYSKDYLGSFFKGATTVSFYSVRQNALVIKRTKNHADLARMLAYSLVQLVDHVVCPIMPEPTADDINLSRAVERVCVYVPQEKKRDLKKLQDKVEELAGNFSVEAIETRVTVKSIYDAMSLHEALVKDIAARRDDADRAHAAMKMQQLMLKQVTWPQGPALPPKPPLLKPRLLSLLVTANAGEVQQYFPHTLAAIADNTTSLAARFVVKDEIAPMLIRDIASALQTISSIKLTTEDKNKLEELLNHHDLLDCLYNPALSEDANLENQADIFAMIAEHVTENKKVDKDKLHQDISLLAGKIDQNNQIKIRPR